MRKKSNHGFTLIEIAIVLVIVGLLVGMGASMVKPLTKRAKYSEAKETINSNKEALIGFAASHNRLPCAANDNNGSCATVGDEFSPAVKSLVDPWGKSFYYIYDNLEAGTTNAICGRSTTRLSVRTGCTDAGCTNPTATTISNVAFIIISGGGNYNNQTGGTQGVNAAATTINVYNVETPAVDNYAGDVNRAEAYDDVVAWVTLDELRIKSGCPGAPLRVATSDLPVATVNNIYNAIVTAADGIPFNVANQNYRWCIQCNPAVAPANLTFRNTANTANILFSLNCAGAAENTWTQSDTIVIGGTPNAAGTFNLTIFVRDNSYPAATTDTIASKAFVLTVQEPPLTIVTPDLPSVSQNTAYRAVIAANGGVPFNVANQNYRWCIQRNPAAAPANLTFRNTANTANILFSLNCAGAAENTWTQSDSVVIGGIANCTSFSFTVYVRDNKYPAATNDNIANKNYTVSVSPCSAYEIWRPAGSIYTYYRVNGSECFPVNINNIITSIGTGGSVQGYTSQPNCIAYTNPIALQGSLIPANGVDTDYDCQINFDGTNDGANR